MGKRVFFVWIAGILFLGTSIFLADSQAQTPDVIRVGVTVSGKFSTEVGPFQRLCKAWVDEVNRQGGIYLKKYGRKLPLKLITYDDRSDAATARRYYERLATLDRVHLLFGPYSSPLTFAASTASERHHARYTFWGPLGQFPLRCLAARFPLLATSRTVHCQSEY